MRVLIATDVDPAVVIGGAERMLVEESGRLAMRGHTVTIVTRTDEPKLVGRCEQSGSRVVRFAVPRSRGPLALVRTVAAAKQAVRAEISRSSFDVVFVQQPLVGAGGAGCGMPMAYNYLSPWSDEYLIRSLERRAPLADPWATRPRLRESLQAGLRRRIEGRVVRAVRRLRLMSVSMAQRCRELHGIAEDRIALLEGGVDLDRFRPPEDREGARVRLGIEPDRTLVFTLRGLEARMGLGNLVEAMGIIRRTRPDVVCLIGGKGPLREALEERVCELDLKEAVRFAGFISDEDLPDVYGAADLFVLPTAALEGFGLVTVEALACGTPVVGTPIGGTPEILRGLDPRLVLSGTGPEAIADGVLANLDRLWGDGQFRTRCREYAADRYAWPKIIERLEVMLQEVAAS